MGNIVVFGSINMDVINHVHQHPLPGEIIKGLGCEYSPGGKGANQAVAASLSGSKVKMAGAVGTDVFGNELIQTLQSYDVNTDFVLKKEGTSGLAFITVSDSGQNNIILSEGANGLFSVQDVESFIGILNEADVVLLQNEIPWVTSQFILEKAKEKNVTVFFNPAPAIEIPSNVLPYIDVLILNETEAETITGISLQELLSVDCCVDTLLGSGIREVVLTLGSKGLLYKNIDGERIQIPGFTVSAADTTAAGDTFIGAFATAYLSDMPLYEKLRYASASAAISVTRKGAQNSIPVHTEIVSFLQNRTCTMEKV